MLAKPGSLARQYGSIEKHAPAVIMALGVQGKSPAEVARQFGVTIQTVYAFRARHEAEIDIQSARLVAQIQDLAIAHQANRIADAQRRRDLLVAVRDSRAAGGTGIETGIVVKTFKMIGSGEDARLIEEYKLDSSLLTEWRLNDYQVAQELGQLVERRAAAGDTNVQINATGPITTVFLGVPDGHAPEVEAGGKNGHTPDAGPTPPLPRLSN